MDCSSLVSSVHGFFRQEYWSGLPFPPPGDLPDPGIERMSPALTDSLPLSHQGSPCMDREYTKSQTRGGEKVVTDMGTLRSPVSYPTPEIKI